MLIKTYERPQPKKKRKKNIAHFLANSNSDMFDALSANNFKNYKALVKSKSNKENRPKKNKKPKLPKQPTRGALETSAKLNKSRSSRKRVTVLESKNKLQRNINVAKFKDSADSPNSPDTTFDRLLKCSRTPLTECNQLRNQISHTPVASGGDYPLDSKGPPSQINFTSTPVIGTETKKSFDISPIISRRRKFFTSQMMPNKVCCRRRAFCEVDTGRSNNTENNFPYETLVRTEDNVYKTKSHYSDNRKAKKLILLSDNDSSDISFTFLISNNVKKNSNLKLDLLDKTDEEIFTEALNTEKPICSATYRSRDMFLSDDENKVALGNGNDKCNESKERRSGDFIRVSRRTTPVDNSASSPPQSVRNFLSPVDIETAGALVSNLSESYLSPRSKNISDQKAVLKIPSSPFESSSPKENHKIIQRESFELNTVNRRTTSIHLCASVAVSSVKNSMTNSLSPEAVKMRVIVPNLGACSLSPRASVSNQNVVLKTPASPSVRNSMMNSLSAEADQMRGLVSDMGACSVSPRASVSNQNVVLKTPGSPSVLVSPVRNSMTNSLSPEADQMRGIVSDMGACSVSPRASESNQNIVLKTPGSPSECSSSNEKKEMIPTSEVAELSVDKARSLIFVSSDVQPENGVYLDKCEILDNISHPDSILCSFSNPSPILNNDKADSFCLVKNSKADNINTFADEVCSENHVNHSELEDNNPDNLNTFASEVCSENHVNHSELTGVSFNLNELSIELKSTPDNCEMIYTAVSSSTHNNNSPLEDSLHVFITRRSHKKVSERGPVDTRKSSKRLRWKCLDNDIYDFNRDVYVTRRSTEQLPNRKNVRVLSAPNSFAWRHLNISGLQLSPCNDESRGINDFNPDIHVTRRSNEQHTNGENLRVISSLDSARRRLNISRLQLSPVDNQSLTVSEDYNPVVSKGSITRRSSERLLKKMHLEADISRRSSRKMDSVVNEKNLSTFDCNNSLDCEASIKSGDLSLTDAVGGINSVNSITKKSLCRRLSHQIIPDKRISGRRASAFRTAKSMKPTDISCNSASVSIIAEEDESLICEESEDMSVANLCNAKNLVLSRCKQSEPIAFEKAFPQRYFHNSKKIGEGVYGEVFLCTRDDGNTVVLKIVPIEGEIVVNGEKQKKYHEILSEVTIAMELSNLRNDSQFSTDCFVEVVSCKCVQGKYPSKLIDLWNEYSSTRGTENDPPSVFDEQQLFIVFELADGGQSLESYHFTSAAQSFSAFMQTSFALAVAENALEFEHRDLHWGNVLISKTAATSIEYKLNGKSHFVPSNGIKVTIIDYTLSRMTYDFCCIFNDLELDPLLFTANGDYQFEIYRLMRDALKSDWSDYSPYTNILWLHYIVDKMLSQVNYKMKKTKTHKTHVNDLRKYYKCILTFKSCYEFVASKII